MAAHALGLAGDLDLDRAAITTSGISVAMEQIVGVYPDR